jgi:mono/diheme cytochrome c family protein
MLRKLLIVATLGSAAGLFVFWFITIPVTVSANALPPYAPNHANGKVMFFAGGCSSCHASPGQDDHSKLGGGLALQSPFGTFYAPNISPDPNDGVGRWARPILSARCGKERRRTVATITRRCLTLPTSASRSTTRAICSPI